MLPPKLTHDQTKHFCLSVYLSAKHNLGYLLQIKWPAKASQSCKFHPTYKTITSNVKFEFSFKDRSVFVRTEINYLVVNQPSRHSLVFGHYSYPSKHGPKLLLVLLLCLLVIQIRSIYKFLILGIERSYILQRKNRIVYINTYSSVSLT